MQCRNPSKARISKQACPESASHHNIGFGDEEGSESWSPAKVKDNIDWAITISNIEELKSNVLPLYWELLLESLNSIVWVTERLYILQDWNFKGQGQLKVETQFTRLTSKAHQYRHLYRMVDTDGLLGASCDCHRISSLVLPVCTSF